MELSVEFGAGRKLTLFGVVKIGIKNFQRAVTGEDGDKRNRVVLPCRLLVGANIAAVNRAYLQPSVGRRSAMVSSA